MARIAGVDLPRRKHVTISLRYLFGIGPKKAREICAKTGIADGGAKDAHQGRSRGQGLSGRKPTGSDPRKDQRQKIFCHRVIRSCSHHAPPSADS